MRKESSRLMAKFVLERVGSAELADPSTSKLLVDAALAGIQDTGLDSVQVEAKLASGQLQAWRLGSTEDGKPSLLGTAITEFLSGTMSGARILYIVALKATPRTPAEGWDTFMATLHDYAKAQGCVRIEALTKSPAVKKLAKVYGFDTSWSLISRAI